MTYFSQDPVDHPIESSFASDGVQFVWDATSIKTAEDCLRKYQYRKLGWEPANKSVHLLFGGWYAKALEHYYKYRALGQDKDEALREVIREALIATWIDGKPWESTDNVKTRENLIRTLVWYVEQFEIDSVEVIKLADGKPAVEYSFTFQVDNGLWFAGHIDRLVKYSDLPYVMDQKTSKNTIGPTYFDQFTPDTQMSMYTMAGQIIYEQPVKGIIIDAAQIAVGFSRFVRGFAHRDEASLNEWYDSAMYTIERARDATQDNNFPMNPSSCHKYNGCEFRKVCSRSPVVREQFLKGDFVQREPWDPLKRR